MPRKHPVVPEMTARERALQRERVRAAITLGVARKGGKGLHGSNPDRLPSYSVAR